MRPPDCFALTSPRSCFPAHRTTRADQLVGLGIGLIPLVGDITMAVWKVRPIASLPFHHLEDETDGCAGLQANSRNAALLEEFLVRRAAKSPATTGAVGEDDEDEMAAAAMAAGRIDKRTGEKVGAASSFSGGHEGAVETAPKRAAAVDGEGGRAAAEASKGGGRRVYGWGKGGGDAAAVGEAGAASTGGTGAAVKR